MSEDDASTAWNSTRAKSIPNGVVDDDADGTNPFGNDDDDDDGNVLQSPLSPQNPFGESSGSELGDADDGSGSGGEGENTSNPFGASTDEELEAAEEQEQYVACICRGRNNVL